MATIVSNLHEVLAMAVKEGASDLHIREGKNVFIRLNGDLLEIEGSLTSREFLEETIHQICVPKDRKHYEETGDADFALQEDGVGRFRVNLHQQRGMHAFTMRHIKSRPPDAKKMNLPPVLLDITENHNGIILVTGATGSGKSTTMAAMLNHMNQTQNLHVLTIEDPIEFVFDDNKCIFQQREVGLDANSFDSALIHSLRQDPDVIVVGEIRNRETMDMALKASQTGHLVMGTLHTQSATATISRILDLYKSEEREALLKSLSQALRAIICQRLIQKIDGRGVVPAHEIMIGTPLVGKLLFEGRLEKLSAAIDASEKEGMCLFNGSLLGLYNRGLISRDLALENSDSPEQLIMRMKGINVNSGGIVG